MHSHADYWEPETDMVTIRLHCFSGQTIPSGRLRTLAIVCEPEWTAATQAVGVCSCPQLVAQ